jgi:hypothetical protein
VDDVPAAARLDEIGAEVERMLTARDARRVALHCEERGHALASGDVGRAAWLSHAGEAWEVAREIEQAKRCYEEALADGGPAWLDVRASLAAVLLDLGDDSRADTLLQELRRDLAKGPLRGPVHDFVGERLELHGRHEEALRWFTAGVVSGERPEAGEDARTDAVDCLSGRFRVRRVLGLPHDRYDELAEEQRRHTRQDLDDLDDLDVENGAFPGAAPSQQPVSLTVLYWPPAEFERLLARWPAMAESYGDRHVEHRTKLERRLRELAATHPRLAVAAATLDEYVAFADREKDDPAQAATRAGFAAHLGIAGRAVAWPPGRNAPCWCGSGTKYKKCCEALRSPAGEA